MDDGDPRDRELPPAEADRIRRRERDRSAKERELMRTGQAKAFKQILDAQAKRAAEAERRAQEDEATGVDEGRAGPRRRRRGPTD